MDLEAIEATRAQGNVGTAMNSCCWEYQCNCHIMVPKLIAEIREMLATIVACQIEATSPERQAMVAEIRAEVQFLEENIRLKPKA